MTAEKKKLPHAHIRVQINDAVFDESGDPTELSEKFEQWLDQQWQKAVRPIRTIDALLKGIEK